jgi:hypothetical protein
MQTPGRPKRRRLRYSLRTFVVVVALVAVGMGIWGRRARHQQRAVESLTALGARVIYEHQWPSWAGLPGGVGVEQAKPPGPEWLRKWLGDEYFVKVVSIDFSSCNRQLTSEDLAHLDLLPKLRQICFDRKQSVSEHGFSRVGRHNTLLQIYLPNPACIDDAAARHLGRLTGLNQLDLSETRITDAGLAHLSHLATLSSLELDGTSVSDAGLLHLHALTSLEYLSLRKAKIRGPGLRHLTTLPSLKSLHLRETELTDSALCAIAEIHGLRTLNILACPRITNAGLVAIAGLFELRRLYVGSPGITDAGVIHLKGLTKLERLYLRDSKITDASMKSLRSLTALEQLSLDGTGVTEKGLSSLNDMPKLRLLQVLDTRIGGAEVYRIHKALPNCHIRYGSRKDGSKTIGPTGAPTPHIGAV